MLKLLGSSILILRNLRLIKVESGEMSKAEADAQRGEDVRSRAVEELENAHMIATEIKIDRELAAFPEKGQIKNVKSADEIQREEAEPRLIEKLRQFVNINDV